MIAFCGITCHRCPAFVATQANDNDKRRKVAEKWSKTYKKHRNLKPEEINCDGCLTDNGILFISCRNCPIRECGKRKGLTNCAYCSEYPCGNLKETFALVPESKTQLDEINGKLTNKQPVL